MKTRKYTLALLIIFTLLHANLRSQSGPPWVKYNVGYNYILRGIDFPENQDNIGYIAGESLTYQGNGIVLKTTDAGSTWTPVWTGGGEGLEGSSFVDVNTGFVAGWPKLSAGWSGFGKTSDGGATWTSLPVVSDLYYFTDVVFKDAANGILFGATNTNAGVWITSNGGTSWTNGTGLAGVPYHGCHVSGNTYFLVDNAGHIQKSVNNGLTWATVYTIPGLTLTGIDFYDNNTGMACGDNGVIVKTYDGGSTWVPQTIGTDIWHDFGWDSPNHLYVCGTPEIVAESNDGGAPWGNGFPQSAMQAALYECIFTPDGSGFICGSQGTLLKRMPSCTASFTASATTACTGQAVTFTSLSTGSNLSYNWSFPGGTPATSTTANPVIIYNNTGVFNVQLIVSNSSWSDTLIKTNYISVAVSPATPVISANGFTLTSNSAAGNQWYLNGTAIASATGQAHTATQSGWYDDIVTQSGCSSDTSNRIYLVMTGEEESAGPRLAVTPVPNHGVFKVAVAGLEKIQYSISIRNDLGTVVYHSTSIPENGTLVAEINLKSSSPGVYLLEFKSVKTYIIRKILIL